jgi:hypothetical protein
MRAGVKGRLRRISWGLGSLPVVVMDGVNRRQGARLRMADNESILENPPTQDVAVHVRDYMRFTKLFKWGALVCLLIGFLVLLILK